jgi:hypothetical protein
MATDAKDKKLLMMDEKMCAAIDKIAAAMAELLALHDDLQMMHNDLQKINNDMQDLTIKMEVMAGIKSMRLATPCWCSHWPYLLLVPQWHRLLSLW